MNRNISLTIDEIHAIRMEHSTRTKDLPNDEYYRLLEEEAAPVRIALEHAKLQLKKADSI